MEPTVSIEPCHQKGRKLVYVLYWGDRFQPRGIYRKFFTRKDKAIAYGNDLLPELKNRPQEYWPSVFWFDLVQYNKNANVIQVGKDTIYEHLP